MNKLGVYIATHKNPYMLRSTVLQILAQTRRPDMVSIHQNGPGEDYSWSISDLITANTAIYWEWCHSRQDKLTTKGIFYKPLRALYDCQCTEFVKFDHDDIYYTTHLRALEDTLQYYGVDCVINTTADVVELGSTATRFPVMDWVWNPTGGMSSGVTFNRAFASEYLKRLYHPLNVSHPAIPSPKGR